MTNQLHGKMYDEDHPENFVELFIKCAREMWLETFCDIHHKIDLHMLSTQLNLDIADAEEVSAATSSGTIAGSMLSFVRKTQF